MDISATGGWWQVLGPAACCSTQCGLHDASLVTWLELESDFGVGSGFRVGGGIGPGPGLGLGLGLELAAHVKAVGVEGRELRERVRVIALVRVQTRRGARSTGVYEPSPRSPCSPAQAQETRHSQLLRHARRRALLR